MPKSDAAASVVVRADRGARWTEGAYEVWLLEGSCAVKHGRTLARGEQAVLWIDRKCEEPDGPIKVIAYLDGQVVVDYLDEKGLSDPTARVKDSQWLGRFYARYEPELRVPAPAGEPNLKPEIYHRAVAARNPSPGVTQAQFTTGIEDPTPRTDAPPAGTIRVRLNGRSSVPLRAQQFKNEAANENVTLIDSGLNLIVDGLPGAGLVDVSADRAVIWVGSKDLQLIGGEAAVGGEIPLELYLEGNVVFRQGEREIYAERMFYDVALSRGVILDAELVTPVIDYQGKVRLRTEVLQQLDQSRFKARGAMLTSSRLGVPEYWFRADDVQFEDIQTPAVNGFTGQPILDDSGQQVIDHQRLATARNNTLFVGGVPVFYWPVLATDLSDPTTYIERVRVRQDRIFGSQLMLDWNTYELLGIRKPPAGTKWEISTDLMSKRGLGLGTAFRYNRPDFFGYGGPMGGFIDAWGIHDSGLDNLGRTQQNLFPQVNPRGRVLARHRQEFANNLQLTSELGYISDQNFLEQYFENEWDQFKDQTTGTELKWLHENSSLNIVADARINPFFTQTEQIRLDHFWLGQPVLNDTLTWYEHTNVGYLRMRTASAPENPSQLAVFQLLPWEVNAQGERAATRQEIDLPVEAGPAKFVPYALGELAHWGQDINFNDLQRAYGQIGLRAALPMWSVDPTIDNSLFNVHGIAHKVTFEAEASYTSSTQSVTQFPLYDAVDDDSQETFRRRFAFHTFNSVPVPWQFDERSYGVRYGLQDFVTSPSTELVDSMAAVRMGVRQRWQTKRGPTDRRRIIDWIVLDTEAVYFPNASRDNFGESFGLLNYDFRWHVGDRVTLVSDGIFDFFDKGQQIASVGGFLNRPPRGSLYLGFTNLQGPNYPGVVTPFNSQVVTLSYTYMMSPKWVSTFGTSFTLGQQGNIGQQFSLSRIGESFLMSLGFTVDASKNNVGVTLAIEPRFLPFSAIGRSLGARVPPAGSFGLE
ncbi:MAG: organic solvent tolerance protein OstA [Pirellulales bacterium]